MTNNESLMDLNKKKSASRGKQSLRLWLRLLACESLVEQHVRTNLRKNFGITLPQFDILAELDYVGKPMTMTDLSKQLMVSNGNVTGVVDRLVREDYVNRLPAKNDRRVQMIKLTDKGVEKFKEMAIQHETWITEIFNGLLLKDIYQLSSLLTKTHERLKNS